MSYLIRDRKVIASTGNLEMETGEEVLYSDYAIVDPTAISDNIAFTITSLFLGFVHTDITRFVALVDARIARVSNSKKWEKRTRWCGACCALQENFYVAKTYNVKKEFIIC